MTPGRTVEVLQSGPVGGGRRTSTLAVIVSPTRATDLSNLAVTKSAYVVTVRTDEEAGVGELGLRRPDGVEPG
ncbi:hypothetical protein [Kribbella sp. NPDC023855]|uniref:hypothetical protein n=1 Tax=Kribbella sp. NPDC023855 TaxID=3154698 RepID=UPI00340057BC